MKHAAEVEVAPSAVKRPLHSRLLALAFALLGVSATVAQPPPPPAPAARAYFYTEPDFRGEVFVVEAGSTVNNLASLRDSRGRPFNDRIYSVQLEGPVRVTMFQHADYRGAVMQLNRDARDLAVFPLELGRNDSWATLISSVQVTPLPFGAKPPSRWDRREAERIVRADYLDFLGREPDPQGQRFYVSRLLDAGWSEEQLRDTFRHSDEFRNRDVDAIIRRSYANVLGREPDAAGLANYRRALGRGMTEGELRADLARSREGNDKHVRDAVVRAYREVLKRDPDAGGLESYTKLMQQKGWSESDVRENLRRSEEYRKLRGG